MVTLLVSATEEDTARLLEGGPRRDFIELAGRLDAQVVYSPGGRKRNGVVGRLLGSHVRQAWGAARDARRGSVVFADGEHIGIPLVLFLVARRKRRAVRVVMLGHYVTRWWKRAAFRLASRAFPGAVVLVHSTLQQARLGAIASPRWRVGAIPYQVDTEYWSRTAVPASPGRPLVLAVGSEGRDYECLARAAEGLDADIVIAAGSHWARAVAGADSLPPNVRYLSTPLRFSELRELYQRAALFVAPLRPVENQSGVTAILEAMSMCLPVVVTANEGQRELVAGPLVDPAGGLSPEATAERGPWVLSGEPAPHRAPANGLYVPVADAEALQRAISLLLADPLMRAEMGRAGRHYAERHFSLEAFVDGIARELTDGAPS